MVGCRAAQEAVPLTVSCVPFLRASRYHTFPAQLPLCRRAMADIHVSLSQMPLSLSRPQMSHLYNAIKSTHQGQLAEEQRLRRRMDVSRKGELPHLMRPTTNRAAVTIASRSELVIIIAAEISQNGNKQQ
ncbi:hypothetical protein HRR80_002392 [Exophiala dermatitidis]|uniref:Uncharacterized protein n=1 Tax=Exophiala dermatitidis TaxID=5970 RepID=A0AAN6EZU0_EXODE|nr:hypothetical protein HRR80_002392 [Exophiala dermatitidis]